MSRKNLTIVITILSIIVLVFGMNFLENRLLPQSNVCTTSMTYGLEQIVPSNTPSTQPAAQLWGNASMDNGFAARLPNGHWLQYLSLLPDNHLLVEESAGQCGPAWVSNYDPSTDTVQQLCSMPNDTGTTDGHYVAWVTDPTIASLMQDVGYLDLLTCKQTQLLHVGPGKVTIGPIISHGYFFWSYGTIHMTNMTTGKTRSLSLPTPTVMQVSWPYLLYNRWDGNEYIYHIYNVETGRDMRIISPPKPATIDINNAPLDWQPTLEAGPTIYWTNNTANIWQTHHADRTNEQPTLVFTIPDPDPHPATYAMDRLFLWSNGNTLYAWDRLLNKEVTLPDGVYYGSTPTEVLSPLIYGNVLLLMTIPSASYTVIDISKLPTIPSS